MDEVGLSVEGKLYEGWTSATITRSLEQFAPTFEVEYSEQWAAQGEPLPINEGDPCEVKVDGEPLIPGYVVDSDLDYDADNHGAKIVGSGVAVDLVDCSAIHKGGQWRNKKLLEIAQDICDPFLIGAKSDVTAGKAFRRFGIQDGETAFEALSRLAQMRGLMLVTDNDGNALFTRRGSIKTNTVIQRGVNVLRGNRRGSMRERFSEYIVKAQTAGDDQFSGRQASQIKRTSEDGRVIRRRPLIIHAENEDTGKELQERVDWERNTRAGRARRATYTLQGWRDDAGKLWAPNTLARVKDEWFRIDRELLIVTVRFTKSIDQGTLTQLELARPEAFDIKPLPPPAPKKQGSDFLA